MSDRSRVHSKVPCAPKPRAWTTRSGMRSWSKWKILSRRMKSSSSVGPRSPAFRLFWLSAIATPCEVVSASAPVSVGLMHFGRAAVGAVLQLSSSRFSQPRRAASAWPSESPNQPRPSSPRDERPPPDRRSSVIGDEDRPRPPRSSSSLMNRPKRSRSRSSLPPRPPEDRPPPERRSSSSSREDEREERPPRSSSRLSQPLRAASAWPSSRRTSHGRHRHATNARPRTGDHHRRRATRTGHARCPSVRPGRRRRS
jgi:hypothetical protein